jgi:hypothetical protein
MTEQEKCSSLLLNSHAVLTSIFAVLSIIFIGVAGYYDELRLDWMPKIFFIGAFVFLAISFSMYLSIRASLKFIEEKEKSITFLIFSTMGIVFIASSLALSVSLSAKHIDLAIFFVPSFLLTFASIISMFEKIEFSLPIYVNIIRWLLALVSFIITSTAYDIILSDESILVLPLESLVKMPDAIIFILFATFGITILFLWITYLSKNRSECISLFFFTVGMIFFILTTALIIFLSFKFIAFDIILASSLVGIALLNKD